MNRFFGNSPEQSFLDQVERACYDKKLTVAQVDALKLYSNLKGWSSGIKWPDSSKSKVSDEPENDSQPTEASPTKFYVGMLVNERGPDGVLHTGRVTAIDSEGKPTIEEIL
jgi:hypothetical protein